MNKSSIVVGFARETRIKRWYLCFFFYILQSATSPGASNDGLTKQQLELIQQIMQQTQQQQQQQTSAQQPQQQRNNSSTTVTAQIPKTQKPSVKSTTSSGNVSNNSGSSNATNNARSSPKPKVWSHVQVSKILKNYHFTLNIDAINMNLYLGTKLISFTLFKRKT